LARLVNEEAMASALQSCARVRLMRDAHSGTTQVKLPDVAWIEFPQLEEYVATYGASVVGSRLAHESLLDHRPRGSTGDWVLDAADVDRLLDVCSTILAEPEDFWGHRAGQQASSSWDKASPSRFPPGAGDRRGPRQTAR
jgi:hypothetical protein